ncbi:hypothetical protein PQR71_24935 [Paraburkholderia fungorum]|uniref:transposase n=1 Tax=Paraburkholderia fungorum TaxID=134537 RepID=UPI0038B7A735
MALTGRYPAEVRAKAIAAVDQRRLQDPRDRTIFREIAQEFDVGEQSLRLWVKHYDAQRLDDEASSPGSKVDKVQRSQAPADGRNDVERESENLRRQVQKLQAENDILKRAFVMFSAEWGKPRQCGD